MKEFLFITDVRRGECELYNIDTDMIAVFRISELLEILSEDIQALIDNKEYDGIETVEDAFWDIIYESNKGDEVEIEEVDENYFKENTTELFKLFTDADSDPAWDLLHEKQLYNLNLFSKFKSRFKQTVVFE
jgi:hypothetical protein